MNADRITELPTEELCRMGELLINKAEDGTFGLKESLVFNPTFSELIRRLREGQPKPE